ncbi:MAG: response regulator [Candidatus Bathyarchaeota archaeon]|nr:response regulator [Candidatus Bathyarchaeota archaeon]
MSFPEKIDVLDLIINVLNEHEKKMDLLVERMEAIVEVLEGHPDFSEALHEHEQQLMLQEEKMFHVLIVDDDEFLADTFEMLLEDAGFLVETAQTGNQALLKASQFDFDMAILDYRLPDITGTELRKRLKERNKDMNVVFLTGQVEAMDGEVAEGLDKDEILLKPISPDELLKITEKLSQKN